MIEVYLRKHDTLAGTRLSLDAPDDSGFGDVSISPEGANDGAFGLGHSISKETDADYFRRASEEVRAKCPTDDCSAVVSGRRNPYVSSLVLSACVRCEASNCPLS